MSETSQVRLEDLLQAEEPLTLQQAEEVAGGKDAQVFEAVKGAMLELGQMQETLTNVLSEMHSSSQETLRNLPR